MPTEERPLTLEDILPFVQGFYVNSKIMREGEIMGIFGEIDSGGRYRDAGAIWASEFPDGGWESEVTDRKLVKAIKKEFNLVERGERGGVVEAIKGLLGV